MDSLKPMSNNAPTVRAMSLPTSVVCFGIEPATLLHIGDNQREDQPACEAARCRFLLCARGRGIDLAKLEALACGTPVLANPNRVLPEYIENGRNGFICHSYGEAIAAVKKITSMGADETAEMAVHCRESARCPSRSAPTAISSSTIV